MPHKEPPRRSHHALDKAGDKAGDQLADHLDRNPHRTGRIGRADRLMTVNLAAIARNYALLKKKTGRACQVAAVLKADAYGLGMKEVVATLENENCPFYYTGSPDEALALRPLTAKPIATLNGPLKGWERDYIFSNILPVLCSLEDVALWRKAAKDREIPLRAILHFDTGMTRLGLSARDAEILAADDSLLEGLHVDIVLSHLACADEKDREMNGDQLRAFRRIAENMPFARASLANSSGIFLGKAWHLDQVRPGMALYGLNPLSADGRGQNPMEPAVSYTARILQVREVKAGDTAGYGATWRFEKDAVTATVAAGYKDGLPRSLSNKGVFYYKGQPCPVRGRISMDLTIVEVSALKTKPRAHETMEIIGPHQSADALAATAGTIGYEILTSLGKESARYHIYE